MECYAHFTCVTTHDIIHTRLRDDCCAQLRVDLNLERSTWELVHALYTDRMETEQLEEEEWDRELMITDLFVSVTPSQSSLEVILSCSPPFIVYLWCSLLTRVTKLSLMTSLPRTAL